MSDDLDELPPPLIQAVMDNDLPLARNLLEDGADPNLVFSDACFGGTGALFWSIGKPELMRLLLARGARADAERVDDGHTCVHEAAEVGDIEALTLLLDAGGAYALGVYDYLENTPLHWAAMRGHIDAMRLLLGHGVDVNANNAPRIGLTPLDCAVQEGHVLAAEILLDAGADPDIPTWMHLTARHRASERGDDGMSALFTSRGITPIP